MHLLGWLADPQRTVYQHRHSAREATHSESGAGVRTGAQSHLPCGVGRSTRTDDKRWRRAIPHNKRPTTGWRAQSSR